MYRKDAPSARRERRERNVDHDEYISNILQNPTVQRPDVDAQLMNDSSSDNSATLAVNESDQSATTDRQAGFSNDEQLSNNEVPSVEDNYERPEDDEWYNYSQATSSRQDDEESVNHNIIDTTGQVNHLKPFEII